MTTGTNVIGYVRVSTAEQGESGLGLDAQRAAIEQEAARRGWNLIRIEQDVESGKSTEKRPGLAAAVDAVDTGQAEALVVTKVDRLCRSLADFADLMERAEARKWAIVAFDLGLDMTTPTGELVGTFMAAVARWERRMIGQRTKEALARKKARGEKLGRKPSIDGDLRRRLLALRAGGLTYQEISDRLNEEGVPTPRGGKQWRPSSLESVLRGV